MRWRSVGQLMHAIPNNNNNHDISMIRKIENNFGQKALTTIVSLSLKQPNTHTNTCDNNQTEENRGNNKEKGEIERNARMCSERGVCKVSDDH